jgi:hypothetical protein
MNNTVETASFDAHTGRYIFNPVSFTKSKLMSNNIKLTGHYIRSDDYTASVTFRVYLPLLSDECDAGIQLYMEENELEEIDLEDKTLKSDLDRIYEAAESYLIQYAQEKLLEEIGIPIEAQNPDKLQNTSMSTYCDIEVEFFIKASKDYSLNQDPLISCRLNINEVDQIISVKKDFALEKCESSGNETMPSESESKLSEFGYQLVYHFPWSMHWAIEYGYDVYSSENDDDIEYYYHLYGDTFTGATIFPEETEDLMVYARELIPIKCE